MNISRRNVQLGLTLVLPSSLLSHLAECVIRCRL